MLNIIKFCAIPLLAMVISLPSTPKKTVVIDVSHGGKDHGSEIEMVSEKEIALQIGTKIKEISEKDDVEIILTRDFDQFLSLQERVDFINGLNPDAVISLHANFSNQQERHGSEFFINGDNIFAEQSNRLAENIAIALNIDEENKKVKSERFFLLKNISCPATLIELGYLSNSEDLELLVTTEGQQTFAEAIYEAIKID